MDLRVDLRKNFVIARHVVTSDQYLIHKDDVVKLGSEEKVGVYEAQPVGFKEAEVLGTKGTYFYKNKVFIAKYLEKL